MLLLLHVFIFYLMEFHYFQRSPSFVLYSLFVFAGYLMLLWLMLTITEIYALET